MRDKPDTYFIDEVLNGNVNAFSHLIERHKDMVFRVALRMLRHHEDAEEITQDCFIKAFEKLGTFRQNSKFSTWLYSIVSKRCISELRKRKHETEQIEHIGEDRLNYDHELNALEQMTKNEQIEILWKAISKLPEDEQLLLNLYYADELDVNELAKITGYSRSNVKIKLFRARKKLAQLMSSSENIFVSAHSEVSV